MCGVSPFPFATESTQHPQSVVRAQLSSGFLALAQPFQIIFRCHLVEEDDAPAIECELNAGSGALIAS